jgi:hypothetical protein
MKQTRRKQSAFLGKVAVAHRIKGKCAEQDARETIGKTLTAIWEHHLSRGLDPNLHFHFLTANFIVGKDGKRYALEAGS